MRPHADTPAFSNIMLTACILFAQLDVHGLLDYALKAGIGGAIWLGYKVVADRIERMRKAKEAVQPSVHSKEQ